MFSKAKSKKSTIKPSRTTGSPAPSILSADLKVTGNLLCDGEVQIDGVVEGDVKCARLTVGQTGEIKGSVITEVALIRGTVSGQIRAGKVTMTRTSRVSGDVLHESLMIEPGALIEGHCKRIGSMPVEQEPQINLIVDQSRSSA